MEFLQTKALSDIHLRTYSDWHVSTYLHQKKLKHVYFFMKINNCQQVPNKCRASVLIFLIIF